MTGTCSYEAARSSTAPARRARDADVRIRDGVITEIGARLAPDGETVVDASGAYVAPGFIDCHTHYDPSVWWDPLVDPMPQHGVTTVVTGNCSLSLTPVRAARPRQRQRRVRLHRGHPRRRVHHRDPVDVGVVRGVARRAAGARHRGERRRARSDTRTCACT